MTPDPDDGHRLTPDEWPIAPAVTGCTGHSSGHASDSRRRNGASPSGSSRIRAPSSLTGDAASARAVSSARADGAVFARAALRTWPLPTP